MTATVVITLPTYFAACIISLARAAFLLPVLVDLLAAF